MPKKKDPQKTLINLESALAISICPIHPFGLYADKEHLQLSSSNQINTTMKTKNRKRSLWKIIPLLLIFSGCNLSGDENMIDNPSSSQAVNPEDEMYQLNLMVSEYMNRDPDESMIEIVDPNIWFQEDISIDQEDAQHVEMIINSMERAVVFYSFNDALNGWDQILLGVSGESLTQATGNTFELEDMEYEVFAGKKKPKKKKKKKKPVSADDPKKACSVKICGTRICYEQTFIPCDLTGETICKTNSDCTGSQGLKGDIVMEGIMNF